MPQVIYLIRHAHKSLTSPTGDLNALGFAEAQALISVFTSVLPKKLHLPIPKRIYSQYPNDILAPPNPASVNRVYQTIFPLAQALHIPIETDFTWTKTNFLPMVERVTAENPQSDDVPLICWQHDTLPDIARLLGASCIKSWGLHPLLDLDATETECEFGQLWVLGSQGRPCPFCSQAPKSSQLNVYQMLFPCLTFEDAKPEKPRVVGVSGIKCNYPK